jgi:putative ATPase
MYTLFDISENNSKNTSAPLAERMRPESLRGFLGQSEIASEGSLLRRAIMLDRLGSCIFWGPPGTGKTTLARIIANSTSGCFVQLNAVTSGVADVKKAVEEASFNYKSKGKKTYLLLDECHRFNKTQQDSLLPSIEDGTIIFIGSTTENPYVAMTPAIVSRCRIFEFKRLSEESIEKALKNALTDTKKGLGELKAEVSSDAIKHIANIAGGDLRTAYNALELAVLTTPVSSDGVLRITLKDAEQSIQKKALSVDENEYYHILSAFCKSLRGSDSNAALYYSQRLINAGCDPMIIARRLIVHSAEDVGIADPNALVVAVSALTALQNVGVPEALIPLSEAIIYVCEAPKSNSV